VKLKTLSILAAVAVALAAFIAFSERKLPSTEERAQRGKRAVVFSPEATTSLTVERPATAAAPGETRLRFEREGAAPGVWWLREPLVARADEFALGQLLQSLDRLEASRRLESVDAEARTGFGLDAPRATVTLEGDYGRKVVDFGGGLPAAESVAAAVRGDAAVSIVPDAVLREFAKPVETWRRRELFDVPREDITALAVELPGGRVVLEKRGDGFAITSPIADRADRERVNGLLSELASLRATTFLGASDAAAIAAASADVAAGVAVAVSRKGAPDVVRVEVGSATLPSPPVAPGAEPTAGTPRRHVRVAGVLAEAETGLAESLRLPVTSWRSTEWSGFEVFRVEGLALEGAGEAIELARQGADWRRGESTLPYGPVSDLLYAVTTAKAADVVSRAEAEARGADLGAVRLRLRLSAKDGEQETLTLHPPLADGKVPATSSAREALVLFASDTARDIETKAAAVRSAEPLKAGAAEE
jgi:hypothetical protein